MGNKVSAVNGVRSPNFFEPGNAVNEIWVGDLEIVSRLPFGDSDMAQAGWPKNDWPKIPWHPFIIPLRATFDMAEESHSNPLNNTRRSLEILGTQIIIAEKDIVTHCTMLLMPSILFFSYTLLVTFAPRCVPDCGSIEDQNTCERIRQKAIRVRYCAMLNFMGTIWFTLLEIFCDRYVSEIVTVENILKMSRWRRGVLYPLMIINALAIFRIAWVCLQLARRELEILEATKMDEGMMEDCQKFIRSGGKMNDTIDICSSSWAQYVGSLLLVTEVKRDLPITFISLVSVPNLLLSCYLLGRT